MQGLLKDLKENRIKQTYVFYGAEKYLARYYKKLLIKTVIPSGLEMNLHLCNDKDDILAAVHELESYPFLHDKRMLVFDDINVSRYFSPELRDSLENLPDYAYVLFLENDLDKRTKAYKYFLKTGALVEFKHQSSLALQKWVYQQVKAVNMQITKDAMESLLSMAGEEMDNIYNELQKVISCCMDKGFISKEDVVSVCIPTLSNRIFEMINKGLRGKIAEAFRMYKDMLLLKESPVKVLILMNRQYLQLLHVKEAKNAGRSSGETAAALGMNPYIVKKEYYNQVDDFSVEFLQKKLKYGCELETKLKTGEISDRLAVELLLLKT